MSRIIPIRHRARKVWIADSPDCAPGLCDQHFVTAKTKKALGPDAANPRQITLIPVRRVK